MRYSARGYWGTAAAAIGLILLGEAFILFAMPPGVSWPKAGLFAILGVGCLSLALASYRYADEVMLQTHKTAWFWGSFGAVIAVVPVIIFVGWRLVPARIHLPPILSYPEFFFVMGMVCMIVLECIGFLLVLAFQRWLR
ncbi:MAG: hypothetical protein WDN08_13455 [Rhizomicrobium sp.]